MLSSEANELLTQVGPGTAGGELLRHYWQPVCHASELITRPTKAVRILGEDLVVWRDPAGEYGVLAQRCLHRGASLEYGFVEDECTIRCAYHGWKYDNSGRVVEQPFEPEGSRFKDKLKQVAYPVTELGGLLFAYLGPEPSPIIPRWKELVRPDGRREFVRRPDLRCNWLQIQENTADVTHTYFLHGHMFHTYGVDHPGLSTYYSPFQRYSFLEFEWGLLKPFTIEQDGAEVSKGAGNPLVFPNMLFLFEVAGRREIHWRVPIDDENTRLFVLKFYEDEDEGPNAREAGAFPSVRDEDDWRDAEGRYRMDSEFYVQDMMAWETPGEVFDRSRENLGASDRGIVMFRRLLRQAIQDVQEGNDPLGVIRDLRFREASIDMGAVAEAAMEANVGENYEVIPQMKEHIGRDNGHTSV